MEQTATSVLNLFPDLELAVEEGEPELATEFFSVVRTWVSELREMVSNTQKANRASMVEVCLQRIYYIYIYLEYEYQLLCIVYLFYSEWKCV